MSGDHLTLLHGILGWEVSISPLFWKILGVDDHEDGKDERAQQNHESHNKQSTLHCRTDSIQRLIAACELEPEEVCSVDHDRKPDEQWMHVPDMTKSASIFKSQDCT